MRPGYLIGRFVAKQPSTTPDNTYKGHTYLIQFGGRTYLVSPEQCRPAAGIESWTLSEDDLNALRNAQKLSLIHI